MPVPVTQSYDARWGYRNVDARRYERRRYGGLVRGLSFEFLKRALGRALEGVAPPGVILDLPCGTGILAELLRSRGFRVIGADISPTMLAVAQQRDDFDGVVRADLEQPPWRPGTFDAVVCSRFLMHLSPAGRPPILRTLAALSRGPLVATVCHPYTMKQLLRRGRRAVGLRAKESQRLTHQRLAAEVRDAGCVLERVVPVCPVLSEVWVVVIRTAP
jgi:2-polyprenyl-3-methyl-5-hydroxy-6-metoxy-1,4-benzoquinol methylase